MTALPAKVDKALFDAIESAMHAIAVHKNPLASMDQKGDATTARLAAETALRNAIAIALNGGDDKAVAWRVVCANGGPIGRPHLTQQEAEFFAKTYNEDPDKYGPYRAEPLFTRPTVEIKESLFKPGDRVRVLGCEPPVYYFLRYRLGVNATPSNWRGAWKCAPTPHGSECVAIHKESEIELVASTDGERKEV